MPQIEHTLDKDDELNEDKVPKVIFVSNSKGHAILEFNSWALRLHILRQSYKLKGTKLWIVEELTRARLKEKPAEFAEVKAARQEGKWVEYHDGKAVIKDFK